MANIENASMNKAYLLIGGNMGDRLANIHSAHAQIEANAGNIIRHSPIYETAAWGLKEQANFYNQALLIETTYSPVQLLEILHAIEQSLGREKIVPLGPRTMDIDILYFNDLIIQEPGLLIPHPYLQDRNFVLVPLITIAADYIHPQLLVSNKTLLDQCKDDSIVYKKIDP